jgi:hypothetical protein
VKCNGMLLWKLHYVHAVSSPLTAMKKFSVEQGFHVQNTVYSNITLEKTKKKKRNNSILTSALILIQKRLLFKYCA